MKFSDSLSLGLILAVLLLGGGGYAVYTMTRGLRNNNPGNIRYDGTPWDGLADPPSDGEFCIFTSPEYGIRAIAKIINNYITVDGVAPTVTAIITRWAPPTENDTAAYIADVQRHNGGSDTVSDLSPVIAGIIAHENGLNPYASATIANGIALAA